MSVTLTNEPFAFGWAKNNNSYRLTCNNVASIGSACNYRFVFAGSLPSNGKHIVLCVDGNEIVFTFGNNGGSYDIPSLNQIGYKMARCFYVTELFSATSNTAVATGTKYLNLSGLTAGFHDVQIYTTDADGRRDGGEEDLVTVQVASPGSDTRLKENYAVNTIIEVVVNNNNVVTTHKGNFNFYPNEDGIVDIPLDIVGSLVPQPDIPSTSEDDVALLTNALVKYRISYGEMWGEVPQVQNMTTGEWKYAIAGEVAERFSRLNLPDWKAGNTSQIINGGNILWVIGEDTATTIRTATSKQEFLYILLYNSSFSIGASRSVYMDIYTPNNNGAEVLSETKTISIANGNVYRIPVGPAVIGVDGGYYRIVLRSATSNWSRIYIVEDGCEDAVNVLLQNKYGFLQSYQFHDVKREISKESEEYVVGKRRYIGAKDVAETYKLRSRLMSVDESKRLASCLPQQYHYIQCNSGWIRATLEDGSFVVRNDEDGMVTVELSMRFVDNQVENMPNGSLSTGISATIADDLNSIVSFSERTTPINNNLL